MHALTIPHQTAAARRWQNEWWQFKPGVLNQMTFRCTWRSSVLSTWTQADDKAASIRCKIYSLHVPQTRCRDGEREEDTFRYRLVVVYTEMWHPNPYNVWYLCSLLKFEKQNKLIIVKMLDCVSSFSPLSKKNKNRLMSLCFVFCLLLLRSSWNGKKP